MYLGYDQYGNIITKDPYGERGENNRRIMGSNELTQEEMMGASRLRQKMQQQMRRAKENARKAAQARALKEADKKRQSLQTSIKNAAFLKKMRFAGYGGMYHSLGGVTGSGLIPHHVSGEEIVSTFKTNYGLGTSDFGSGQMGGVTADLAKKYVSSAYNEMLRYEIAMDKLRTEYRKLDKTSAKYKKLKASYDAIAKDYMQTPVGSYRNKNEAGLRFSAAVVSGLEVFDKNLASQIEQMFMNPLGFHKKVLAGQVKNPLAGFFGSEFDLGFGALPLAAWGAIGVAISGAALMAYNALFKKDPAIDAQIEAVDKLISEGIKSGKLTEAQTTALIEQRKASVETKAKESVSKSATGIISTAAEGVGSIAKYATWGVVLFAIVKFGFPLLQAQMAKKSQPSEKAEPAQLALAGA
jgi:hypothetical protein